MNRKGFLEKTVAASFFSSSDINAALEQICYM